MSDASLKKEWGKTAEQLLLGKTVTKVRYMTAAEQEAFMWDHAAVIIELSGGVTIFPSADDEGNDAGAVFTNNEKLPCIPVI